MNPIFFVLPIIAILTYTLGLSLKLDDFRLLIKRPLPMFVGLFGQLILLPVIAFVIAYYSNLPVIFFVGVVLIACCPGGPSSNIFTYVAKGDVALSVSMTAVSSIVTLFTLPFIMALTVDFALAQGMTDTILGRVELPVGNLLIQNVVLMLIPILLGVATKFYFKNAAVKLEKVLSKFAFPALIFLATIFFVKHYHNIANHLDKLGLCVLALVLIAVATSSLLSTLFKQSSKIKRTIVIEVAMQNAAQAIAIASSPFVFNNEIMAIPAIIYALFMNVVLLTYVGFLTVRDKKVVVIYDQ
ncbi:MAG: bile acid:sodium symporter family protein [Succinivibrio sp.]|nr:bile acid:sodium symporter family protein [Succinivibrio sp.]